MGQPEPAYAAGVLDDFRRTFREFHAAFADATEAGVDLATLLAVLEDEGVELPDVIKMML